MPATKTPRRPRRPGLGKRALQPTLKLPEYRALTTLAELETVCQVPVVVECLLGDQPVRFEGRRLKPCEEGEIKALLESAFPPELPPEQPGGEARYDLRHPDYLARRETAQRTARALVLYYAFPIFRDGFWASLAGNPTSQDEPIATGPAILKFVESRPLDVSILDLAYQLVTREMVRVDPRRVGFTSGNNSPAS